MEIHRGRHAPAGYSTLLPWFINANLKHVPESNDEQQMNSSWLDNTGLSLKLLTFSVSGKIKITIFFM